MNKYIQFSALHVRENKNCIITGDFNYNLFNLKYHEETENFYNIMTSNSFRTLITKPTRVTDNSSTLIDHIWVNDMSDNKMDCKILVTDITDHFPVLCIKSGTIRKVGYTKVKYRPITENNIINF